jgi:small subunit ribosomal protein S8
MTMGDLLIKIKNAYMAGHKSLQVYHTKQGECLCRLLQANKMVENIEVSKEKIKKIMTINLVYEDKKPTIVGVKQFSKPGVRIYCRASKIAGYSRGMGTIILSTPEGLMTGSDARKKNLGGELIARVW